MAKDKRESNWKISPGGYVFFGSIAYLFATADRNIYTLRQRDLDCIQQQMPVRSFDTLVYDPTGEKYRKHNAHFNWKTTQLNSSGVIISTINSNINPHIFISDGFYTNALLADLRHEDRAKYIKLLDSALETRDWISTQGCFQTRITAADFTRTFSHALVDFDASGYQGPLRTVITNHIKALSGVAKPKY